MDIIRSINAIYMTVATYKFTSVWYYYFFHESTYPHIIIYQPTYTYMSSCIPR